MNRNYILAAAFGIISLILIFILIAGLVKSLNGDIQFINHKPALIDDSETLSYSYNQSEISSIKADLVNEAVFIGNSYDKQIHVKIENPDTPNAPEVNLKGNTLYITKEKLNIFSFSPRKGSTVYIEIPANLSMQKFSVETVSGSIKASDLKIWADEVKIESVSGSIKMSEISSKSLKFESTSGTVKAGNVSADSLSIETVSGSIELKVERLEKKANIESISGSVKLSLKKASSFALSYKSKSGSFSSDFGNLSKNKEFKHNGGKAEISVSTVSGSIKVSAF
ncbi:MAG: DUF4097 family beta strand repeat protein [Spirochaetaceae bacterium]|nr:DUF4097 family beta strand repeat protein [Spirochaetaceae bacterium]